MSTLGKAIILFGADTAMFRGDVGRAVHIFEQGMGRMTKAYAGFNGLLGGAVSFGGMLAFTKSVIDQADQLDKLKQKTGIQVRELSELKFAAETGNVTNEQFNAGLREWNKTLVEASNSGSKAGKVLTALGVDIKAGPFQSFRQFAEQFSKITDEELRLSVAQELLKKSGEAWIPVLAGGANGLDEAAQKARDLGLVISDDFAEKAARFNDNMLVIRKVAVGFTNAILDGGVLSAIDEIGIHLEKAARKGELLRGIGTELAKIAAANIAMHASDVGRGFGPGGALLGMVAERIGQAQADALFERGGSGRSSGRIRGTGGEVTGTPAGMFRPSSEELRTALAETDPLVKRQIAAVQQMEEKRRGLFELTEQELMLERVLTGTYKDFNTEAKVRLLNLAAELDGRSQLIKIMDLQGRAHLAEAAARERGDEVFREFAIAGREHLDQLQFEISLVGIDAREQEKLNAVRSIELDLLERKRQAAQAYGDDVAGLMVEVSRLEGEASRQRGEVLASIDERQKKEREWLVGAKIGFQEYSDAATNAAANTRDAIVSGLDHAEDALVQFLTTGKLEFRSFANAIAADMARLFVRQKITGPLAELGLNALLGAGVGQGYGFDESGMHGAFDANLASGGIMTTRGRLPLARYAGGGVANRPQLALFGEGRMPEAFVPLPDGKRIPVALEGGGGNGNVYIDATGADAAAIDRLWSAFGALNMSVERRAVGAAVRNARRGGALRRELEDR